MTQLKFIAAIHEVNNVRIYLNLYKFIYLFIYLSIYLFIYLFILYLKVEKHQIHKALCIKKLVTIKLQYIHANWRQLPKMKTKYINLMIIIKVINLKTNSCLWRQLCKKCQTFIELMRARGYVKPTLEMYVLQSLQGQFLGFHFLILFLKTLKLGKFLYLPGRMFQITGSR